MNKPGLRRKIPFLLLVLWTTILQAQPRISDHNNIGWFTNTTTVKFAGKWSLHMEYQWRRNDFITTWQQSLLRTGINYHIHANAVLRAGYGWIETFPYGDYPINALGKQFAEHRIYQVLTTTQKTGRFEFTHRYMLEQRWLAVYNKAASVTPDKWNYVNRLRYMLRVQTPLRKKSLFSPSMEGQRADTSGAARLKNRFPYAALYDEIFIGFGENVGQNVFDQNRTGVVLGYQFNKKFRVEGGYFCQIVQLGRQVGPMNVFQYNQGFVINSFLNLSTQRKKGS